MGPAATRPSRVIRFSKEFQVESIVFRIREKSAYTLFRRLMTGRTQNQTLTSVDMPLGAQGKKSKKYRDGNGKSIKGLDDDTRLKGNGFCLAEALHSSK